MRCSTADLERTRTEPQPFFQVLLAAGSMSYMARSACLNGQEKAQEVMCAEAKGWNRIRPTCSKGDSERQNSGTAGSRLLRSEEA